MEEEPRFPEVRMNVVRPRQPVVGTVISNELCLRGKSASFVKHTVIDVSGTPLAGAFRAGQSFGVIPPGTDAEGRPYKLRLYSVACPSWGEDGQGRHISTTPKRLIDEYVPQGDHPGQTEHSLFLGVCSNYLCDLREGAPVALSGPQGKRFLLPLHPNEHDYLFLATGTGVAPFRGMVLELLTNPEGPTERRIDLVMGTPYSTDLLYDELFRDLAAEFPNFNYHTAISRESDARYVGDLLGDEMDYFLGLLKKPGTLIYVCGLEGMERGVFETLIEHDIADGYLTRRGDRIKPTARCRLEVY